MFPEELLSGSLIEYLRGLNFLSIIFRFMLATICGSVIGIERGKNSHAAGLRTHIVVCIGGAAAIMINQYLNIYINPGSDPARMGAQVISGIGFLGAGTIMVTGHNRSQQVRGLTTAAGLWASACMGLAIGIGFYEGAIIMCLFLFVVIAVLTKLDDRYLKKSSSLSLYMEYIDSTPLSDILKTLRSADWRMTNVETYSRTAAERRAILLDIHCSRGRNCQDDVIELLQDVEGVLYVDKL